MIATLSISPILLPAFYRFSLSTLSSSYQTTTISIMPIHVNCHRIPSLHHCQKWSVKGLGLRHSKLRSNRFDRLAIVRKQRSYMYTLAMGIGKASLDSLWLLFLLSTAIYQFLCFIPDFCYIILRSQN